VAHNAILQTHVILILETVKSSALLFFKQFDVETMCFKVRAMIIIPLEQQ
jgi:hypothetical protein